MANLDKTIEELRVLFTYESDVQMQRNNMLQDIGKQNPALQDEMDTFLNNHIKDCQKKMNDKLLNLLRYPPHHIRHLDKLKDFHSTDNTCPEKSVFIMTKFPEGNNDVDNNLKNIINLVSKTIKDCKCFPRIASDRRYHPMLWDNVELYLLGCDKGIAIVEDKYKPELNPNVAIEWGFMRGMGKDVLFLMEENFHHNRADWEGFIKEYFSWENPEEGIAQAIKKWLQK